ncbi:MAG: hypothetical protein GQ546_01780 [Gammaproteobacteria bacterium]|nr:hypothetical protein [Gammaproteobacteria bacterium]
MAIKSYLTKFLFLFYCLLWAGFAMAEPLRLLVPKFFGPEPLSQHVRTTIYFEMVNAFKAVDTPDKGAWILYGQEKLKHQNHNSVLAAAKWPSVRADLAIWGQVRQYDDGVVLQPYLTVTSLIKKRQIRPELWTLTLKDNEGRPIRFELDIPGQFYQFEPLLLNTETILAFENPQGMPIYSGRKSGAIIGHLGEVIRVYELYDDAQLIATNGIKGWLRIKPIGQTKSEAINFSKGMVRLLRGDWRGTQRSFTEVLKNHNLPQKLRIHALIYTGLAKEKSGVSGMNEFSNAYDINRLDKAAAAYLLMSQAAEISRLQHSGMQSQLQKTHDNLQSTLKSAKNLFAKDDPWLAKMRLLLKQNQ